MAKPILVIRDPLLLPLKKNEIDSLSKIIEERLKNEYHVLILLSHDIILEILNGQEIKETNNINNYNGTNKTNNQKA